MLIYPRQHMIDQFKACHDQPVPVTQSWQEWYAERIASATFMHALFHTYSE